MPQNTNNQLTYKAELRVDKSQVNLYVKSFDIRAKTLSIQSFSRNFQMIRW